MDIRVIRLLVTSQSTENRAGNPQSLRLSCAG
jgi:hypothetical protein